MDPALDRLVHVLANPTARALLAQLQQGPSHPRALAERLGLTEGQVQRRLRDLSRAGLVSAAWRYDGRTTHRYALEASAIRFSLEGGAIRPAIEAARRGGAVEPPSA